MSEDKTKFVPISLRITRIKKENGRFGGGKSPVVYRWNASYSRRTISKQILMEKNPKTFLEVENRTLPIYRAIKRLARLFTEISEKQSAYCEQHHKSYDSRPIKSDLSGVWIII